MRAFRLHFIAAALLLLAGPTARAAQDGPRTYDSRYDIRYLDIHTAETLAWEQCPDKKECVVMGALNSDRRGSVLTVRADSETHAKLARVLAERDSAPQTQVFHLVLLAAGDKPNGPAPALAPGAQKALDDLKRFLPFKSYRTVDTALIRVTRDDVAQARVAGLQAASYKVALRFRSAGADGKKLLIDGFGLHEDNGRDLIQTSFAMDVGESVVVGTSAVGGSDEALVAILTAVP
jgi:hypothetical protein